MNSRGSTVSVLASTSVRGVSSSGNGEDQLPGQCADCFLQQHCLASKLDTGCRIAISEITDHPKPLQKGRHLYRQNNPFSHVYIVRSGAVKTYYLDEDGEENISGFYLPGEMFGIDGVSSGVHRFSAQALDTTAVCAVEFEGFEALFAQFPAIQRQFTAVLCDEIYARQQPLLRLRQFPAEERLSAFLLDLAQRVQRRNQDIRDFNLPMPRRDIARYLCLAEETLSRLFRRLQERGLLTMQGRRVVGFDEKAFRSQCSATQ